MSMTGCRTRVKVCGVCSADDAARAVAAGADAIGVVLADSPRRLTVQEAEVVLAALPPLTARIGVFVDAEPWAVAEAVERLRLSAVQLSGTESPEYCAEMPVPVIKAFHVGDAFDLEEVGRYTGAIAAALLDTAVADLAGGTGRAFRWDAVTGRPEGLPIVVAGGLTPENVGEAIGALRPYAVDVSTGVEAVTRVKDPRLLEEFCSAVRCADGEGSA